MKKTCCLLLTLALVFALLPGVALAGGNVAEVAGNQYDTVQEAINVAGSAGEVVLLQDVTESITIPDGKDITLKLEAFTLTAEANKDAIYVAKGAQLTIVAAAGGKVQASTSNYAAIFNNGTTALEGGTYTRSGGNWYTIVNHGGMTIENGTTVTNMNTDDVSSLVENGYSSYNGQNERSNYVANTNEAAPTLTINGGNFSTAGYNAVKNDEGGVLEIHDGVFTSKRASGAVIQNWNKATITGGTYTATEQNAAVVSSGTWGNHALGDTEITGGNFIVDENATSAVLFGAGAGSGGGGSMQIKGATFDGSFGTVSYDIEIESCTSTEQVPSGLLASNAGQLRLTGKNGDGYHVGSEQALQQAVNGAAAGDTIDVLSGNLELAGLPDGVTVKNSGNGTVSVDGENVASGEEVTVESELLYSIVKQPTDSIVTEGDAATFSVEVEYREVMIGYQWRKSTDGGKTFKAIEGANAKSYTTSATTLENDGYQYDCIVFDASRLIRTRANNAPSLTDADIASMVEGEDYLRSKVVTLHVKAEGEEPAVPPTGDSPLLYVAVGAAVLCLLGLCLPVRRDSRG